jgi:hypothetical protein
MTPDQPPTIRPNFLDREAHEMFTLGPTKCAVILWDMVKLYDRKTKGNMARKVASSLQKVDRMIDMVKRDYAYEVKRRQDSLNSEFKKTKAPFREDLIYKYFYSVVPHLGVDEMDDLLRAVVVERINGTKVGLGLMKKKDVGYVAWQLAEWIKSPSVQTARFNFAKTLPVSRLTVYRVAADDVF